MADVIALAFIGYGFGLIIGPILDGIAWQIHLRRMRKDGLIE
jgi:hypothetical protein